MVKEQFGKIWLNTKPRSELRYTYTPKTSFWKCPKKHLMKPLKPETKSKATEQTEVWRFRKSLKKKYSVITGVLLAWRSLVTSALSLISRKVTSRQSQLIVTSLHCCSHVHMSSTAASCRMCLSIRDERDQVKRHKNLNRSFYKNCFC